MAELKQYPCMVQIDMDDGFTYFTDGARVPPYWHWNRPKENCGRPRTADDLAPIIDAADRGEPVEGAVVSFTDITSDQFNLIMDKKPWNAYTLIQQRLKGEPIEI